jgi:hypothetical protein
MYLFNRVKRGASELKGARQGTNSIDDVYVQMMLSKAR